MLKHRKNIPLDYSLCQDTVTVYHREGLTRRVVSGVHFEQTARRSLDTGRETEERGFLLIIPADRKYGDYSPHIVAGDGQYGDYSPHIVAGDGQYGGYSPHTQSGDGVYGGYNLHIQPGDRVYGGYGPHIQSWADTAGFPTVESVKHCRFRGQICHTEVRG